MGITPLKNNTLWFHIHFCFHPTATAPTVSMVHWRRWTKTQAQSPTPVKTVSPRLVLLSIAFVFVLTIEFPDFVYLI